MRKKIMITMMLSFFMYTGYAQNEESVISENVILQEDTLSQETSNPIMTAFTDSLMISVTEAVSYSAIPLP